MSDIDFPKKASFQHLGRSLDDVRKMGRRQIDYDGVGQRWEPLNYLARMNQGIENERARVSINHYRDPLARPGYLMNYLG